MYAYGRPSRCLTAHRTPAHDLGLVVTALLAFALSVSACGGAMLPQTDIPATEENRGVYDQLFAYKDAMERRDVDGIMAMVSRDYYENNGTTHTDTDDYGYETLRDEVLPRLRENVRAVQYHLLLRAMNVDGDHATADYEFFYRFQFVEGGQDGWAQKNDFNRLEFQLEDGAWMIISGL